MVIERVLIAVVAKYVCGKLVVQWLLVAVVATVTNEISDYSVINRCWLRVCKGSRVRLKGCKVSMLTFGDRKGLDWNGCKVCM